MSETLESVAIDVDQRQLAEQLLAQAKEQGIELVGPNGLPSSCLCRAAISTAENHNKQLFNFSQSLSGCQAARVLIVIYLIK